MGVGKGVKPSDSKERGCRIFRGSWRVQRIGKQFSDSQRIGKQCRRMRSCVGELRDSSSTTAHQLVFCGCQQVRYARNSNRRGSSVLSRRYCRVRLTRRVKHLSLREQRALAVFFNNAVPACDDAKRHTCLSKQTQLKSRRPAHSGRLSRA